MGLFLFILSVTLKVSNCETLERFKTVLGRAEKCWLGQPGYPGSVLWRSGARDDFLPRVVGIAFYNAVL